MILNCFSAVPMEMHPGVVEHGYCMTTEDPQGSGALSPSPGYSETAEFFLETNLSVSINSSVL